MKCLDAGQFPGTWNQGGGNQEIIMLTRTRMDLKPLCDVHLTEGMVLVELILAVGPDVFPKTAFACSELGCDRHYDARGYFSVSKGQGIVRGPDEIKCPHDGLAMYISRFELQGSVRHWQCSQLGCNGSKVTNG